jgi:hypothetical protein
LLDGLDEIADASRESVEKDLFEWQNDEPEASFVVTTRRYHGMPVVRNRAYYQMVARTIEDFDHYEILPWTEAQVFEFFRLYSHDWRSLAASWQSSRLRDFRTPLFVELFARASDMFRGDQVLDPLTVVRRAVDYAVGVASVSRGLEPAQLTRYLERLAYAMNQDRSFVVTLVGARTLAAHDEERTIGAVLETGLVKSSERYNLSFTHLYLQEFFLTSYIRRELNVPEIDIVFSPYTDPLVGLRINTGDIVKLNDRFKALPLPPNTRFVPLFATSGSVLLLGTVLGLAAAVFLLRAFLRRFVERLGEKAADRLVDDPEFGVPEDILQELPQWLRQDREALKVFSREMIISYTQGLGHALSDAHIARAYTRAVFATNFRQEATPEEDVEKLFREYGIPRSLPDKFQP